MQVACLSFKNSCPHMFFLQLLRRCAVLSSSWRLLLQESSPEGGEWPVTVRLSNGKSYGADFVISAVGVSPNTDWLQGALPLAENGGIIVDRRVALPSTAFFVEHECEKAAFPHFTVQQRPPLCSSADGGNFQDHSLQSQQNAALDLRLLLIITHCRFFSECVKASGGSQKLTMVLEDSSNWKLKALRKLLRSESKARKAGALDLAAK